MFTRVPSSSKRLQNWLASRRFMVSNYMSTNGPAGDCFYLLDTFLLLAGTDIQSDRTPKWTNRRNIRIFVNSLFAFQAIVTVIQMVHAWETVRNVDFQTVLIFTKLVGVIAIGIKWLLLISQTKQISSVLNFITSNQVNSGDEAGDAVEMKKFNRSACLLMRITYGITLANAVLLLVPSAITEQAIGLPPLLTNYGKLVSRVLYFFSTKLLFIGTVPKFLSNMACIGLLIMGMRSKLAILVHRYSRILNQPYVNTENYFTRMERDVREALNQETEYRRQFETLASLVKKAFFIAHFYSIYSLGTCFYLSHNSGLNFLSGTLVSLAVAYIFKYYIWCYLVDSLQDVTDSMGDLIYEHCAQMPYSRQHHSQYLQLKTSLIIIWMNTRSAYSISCMGMLNISTKTFVSFLNTIYSVMMFFINMV